MEVSFRQGMIIPNISKNPSVQLAVDLKVGVYTQCVCVCVCVCACVCVCVCVCMCMCVFCVWVWGGEEVVAGYLSILSMSQIETIPKLVTSCITHMIHIKLMQCHAESVS